MSEDSEREYARMAEEAEREAREAAGRARTEAERVAAETTSGEGKDEALRQQGVIYGGLVGVAVLMIQPFIAETATDASAKISVIAFAVAIPLLAALIMVNRQETFRRRRTTSVMVTLAPVAAQGAAIVGIAAGFWHIHWVAGVIFLVTALVAVGVHSAGWYKVEVSRQPSA